MILCHHVLYNFLRIGQHTKVKYVWMTRCNRREYWSYISFDCICISIYNQIYAFRRSWNSSTMNRVGPFFPRVSDIRVVIYRVWLYISCFSLRFVLIFSQVVVIFVISPKNSIWPFTRDIVVNEVECWWKSSECTCNHIRVLLLVRCLCFIGHVIELLTVDFLASIIQ